MDVWKSESIGKLAGALSKAQGEFAPIARSREVKAGPYSFTYAPLDEVLGATRPALVANGLALTQLLAGDALLTTLVHASGEWIASSVGIAPLPAKIQDLGSRLTYLRRYSIAAILGVAPDEDDDGGPGDHPDYKTQARPQVSPPRQPAKAASKPAAALTVEDEYGVPVTPRREPGEDDGMPEELRAILNRIAAAKSEKDLTLVAVDAAQLEESLRADARKAYNARLAVLRGGAK